MTCNDGHLVCYARLQRTFNDVYRHRKLPEYAQVSKPLFKAIQASGQVLKASWLMSRQAFYHPEPSLKCEDA